MMMRSSAGKQLKSGLSGQRPRAKLKPPAKRNAGGPSEKQKLKWVAKKRPKG